jgi:branched-chain amino acid transport system ATP-binding protein
MASPLPPKPLIEIAGLSVGYGDEPVVRDVDLAVAPGSITTVIGANGAGKSTLLRGLYGMIRTFAGTIRLAGEEIQALDPVQRLARGLSFVPQGRCNFQKMSVRENLELGGYTLPKAEVRPAIERVAAMFPMLREKWSVLAGNMSGGEQQILEMAIALLLQPAAILLDEPSLGLSPKMLAQVFATVRQIRADGVTIVMVEQNARAALLISDVAVVMELGRKSFEGAARAVLDDPRIKAAYLGG